MFECSLAAIWTNMFTTRMMEKIKKGILRAVSNTSPDTERHVVKSVTYPVMTYADIPLHNV